jgi:serine/threonine protein kinase
MDMHKIVIPHQLAEKPTKGKDEELPYNLAKDLLIRLIEKDPNKRLGKKGGHEILEHQLFKNMNPEKIRNRTFDTASVFSMEF